MYEKNNNNEEEELIPKKFLTNNELTIISKKIYFNKISYYLLSFAQGISDISALAVSYYLKDILNISPATMSQLYALIALPWTIKPLFGLITDLYPLFGFRRKSYILLCGVFNLINWLILSYYVVRLFPMISLLFLISCFSCFCSVIGEAIVVEVSQLNKKIKNYNNNNYNKDNDEEDAKDYVSIYFIIKNFGCLLSAYFKGKFVEWFELKTIFLISSFVPILIIISGFILIEEKYNNNNREYKNYNLFINFINFIKQKIVYIPTLFIFLFTCTPSYGDALFYFVTERLNFTPENLGVISLFSNIFTIIAIFLYKFFFKNIKIKIIIFFGILIYFIFSFMAFMLVKRFNIYLGINDFYFALLSSSVISLIGEFLLMPILSLAAELCPKNLEGTVYSLFMSTLNFGGVMSNLFGSCLMLFYGISKINYERIGALILTSNLLALIPLPFLFFIDDKYFVGKKE